MIRSAWKTVRYSIHSLIDGHTKAVPAGKRKNLIILDVNVVNLDYGQYRILYTVLSTPISKIK
jgi:hypothetical protein